MQAADIIATSSVFISVCSLGAAVCALGIQREHDRKSVQPIPQIDLGDYENHIYVAIENAGVGPFIVESICVENTSSKRTTSSLIEQMSPLPTGYFWTTFMEQIQQEAIPAQENIILLQLDEPKNDNGGFVLVRHRIRAALGGINVVVRGRDIYGNKLQCSRPLSYFHRSLSAFDEESAPDQSCAEQSSCQPDNPDS